MNPEDYFDLVALLSQVVFPRGKARATHQRDNSVAIGVIFFCSLSWMLSSDKSLSRPAISALFCLIASDVVEISFSCSRNFAIRPLFSRFAFFNQTEISEMLFLSFLSCSSDSSWLAARAVGASSDRGIRSSHEQKAKMPSNENLVLRNGTLVSLLGTDRGSLCWFE